ncbi:MAG: GNAT family N-acetyltransferase [Dehalococcoidales bacterium]|nr:MAG: GNAT family N-acetyltransferase [Dehalococcoidales bacterium]
MPWISFFSKSTGTIAPQPLNQGLNGQISGSYYDIITLKVHPSRVLTALVITSKGSVMRIREATAEDRAAWNTFVDTEGGDFIHYYDWKQTYETRGDQFIPLLAENAKSELIGILPIVKEKRFLSSILHSDIKTGGFLLKSDLSEMERCEAISAFLEYVEAYYSKGCSRFTLKENLPSAGKLSEEPTTILTDNGFRFRYDALTHLPCTFILELKQPFEENIWKGLWSHNLRKKLNKAGRKGVVTIQDPELGYTDIFIDMVNENYKRHRSIPPTRDEIKVTLNTFRDKVKLFITLLDNKPIMTFLSYYHASTCFLAEIGSYSKDIEDMNILCYMTAIEDACNAGYRFVDFSYTATSGLAFFKGQFKGTRVPFRIYEKRYSVPRTLIELGPVVIKKAWQDKTYIWKKRQILWDRIVHW